MMALLAREKYFEGSTQRFRTEDKTLQKISLTLKSRKEGKNSSMVHTSRSWQPKNGFSSWSAETDLARSDVNDDASFL
jgi:hypothetical protein